MENLDHLTSSYFYELDQALIASRPAIPRDSSRLLVYYQKSDRVEHRVFRELPDILPSQTQLVFNQSKVYPCRLMAQKESGGKAEIFLLSLQPDQGEYPVLIKSNGKKKLGDKFLAGDLIFEITHKSTTQIKGVFNLDCEQLQQRIYQKGMVPIPPYIREGQADEQDKSDYQTLYAKDTGSVAAPTAGLHFTQAVFDQLDQKQIERAFVTLHVGLGTFKPVATDNILDHHMHTESFSIDQQNQARLNRACYRVAVGTTSLRVLESTYGKNGFEQTSGDTSIFLYPGIEVQSVQGLLTNFHLPESTLLMLVSALIGREKTLELYRLAVDQRYRFYSYGDAMLILRDQ